MLVIREEYFAAALATVKFMLTSAGSCAINELFGKF